MSRATSRASRRRHAAHRCRPVRGLGRELARVATSAHGHATRAARAPRRGGRSSRARGQAPRWSRRRDGGAMRPRVRSLGRARDRNRARPPSVAERRQGPRHVTLLLGQPRHTPSRAARSRTPRAGRVVIQQAGERLQDQRVARPGRPGDAIARTMVSTVGPAGTCPSGTLFQEGESVCRCEGTPCINGLHHDGRPACPRRVGRDPRGLPVDADDGTRQLLPAHSDQRAMTTRYRSRPASKVTTAYLDNRRTTHPRHHVHSTAATCRRHRRPSPLPTMPRRCRPTRRVDELGRALPLQRARHVHLRLPRPTGDGGDDRGHGRSDATPTTRARQPRRPHGHADRPRPRCASMRMTPERGTPRQERGTSDADSRVTIKPGERVASRSPRRERPQPRVQGLARPRRRATDQAAPGGTTMPTTHRRCPPSRRFRVGKEILLVPATERCALVCRSPPRDEPGRCSCRNVTATTPTATATGETTTATPIVPATTPRAPPPPVPSPGSRRRSEPGPKISVASFKRSKRH